jgi:hypothetical protein
MPDMNVSKEKTNPPIAVLFEVLCFLFLFAISPALSSELVEINGRFYDCDRQYRVEQNGSTVYLVTETAGSWELDEGDLKAFKPGDTGFYYTEIDSNPPYIITQNKWKFDIKNTQVIDNLKRMKQQDLERASSKEWAESVNMRVMEDTQWAPLREQLAEKEKIRAEEDRIREEREHELEKERIRAEALVEAEKAKKPPVVFGGGSSGPPIVNMPPPIVHVW